MDDTKDNAGELPGSTKSALAKDNNPEQIDIINRSFAEGFRLFSAKDFVNAAEELAKTNELSVELYGQFAPECFKPHFYYGLSMLEIAQNRVQEQLLMTVGESGAIEEENEYDNEAEPAQEGEEKEEHDQDEKPSDKEGANGAEKAEADSPSKNKTTEITQPSGDDDQVESTTKDGNNEDVGDETLKSDAEEHAALEAEEDGDDEDDLSAERLAWESLEVARKICEKMETNDAPEWTERRAEVLSALSECMIISDQYETALVDLETLLDIQRSLYSPSDRRIAETHYNMGRCYRNAEDFEKATLSFLEAGRQLQSLIDAIDEQGDAATEEEKTTSQQLKDLVKEIDENVRDAYESMEIRAKQLNEQREIVTNVFKEALDSNVSVDDITQHIRRRDVKKTSVSNGDSNSVPTNSAGSALTTSTTTDTVEDVGKLTTTDVHTGNEIEMEEAAAAASISGSGDGFFTSATKRPATGSITSGSKKAKVSEMNKGEQIVTD